MSSATAAQAAPNLAQLGNRFLNWFIAGEGAEALVGPFSGLEGTLKTLGVIDVGVKAFTGRDLASAAGGIVNTLFRPDATELDEAAGPINMHTVLQNLNRLFGQPAATSGSDRSQAAEDRDDDLAREQAQPGSILDSILAQYGSSTDTGKLAWKAGIGGLLYLFNRQRQYGFLGGPAFGMGNPWVDGMAASPWVAQSMAAAAMNPWAMGGGGWPMYW